ncbi:tyrosine-type recombinase/integrase [Sphingomonas yabuuchiae]|uniref:Integrase n=1 Tax=Sphingomonas yabuuchiae TaxID=172044 RepID=A0AA40ZWF2_9SPHN|nr:integrase arm-type DNA-binding domain-containing protein [Sphingomonas yabuuchiae]MBB4611532.1 integrase [Sphingomonas yabuuchiae]MBN3557466.1 integrase arm-type DNA-binding domain-containing protein [Sphingomonas yabuuchiae]
MLSNAALKSARPKPHAYKMWDAQGLHLYVAPTGLRAWRVRIRADRREAVISLGSWPDVSLDDARESARLARGMIVQGSTPKIVAAKLAERLAQSAITFQQLARDWHAARRDRWTAVHAADVLASLERHVFPAIGEDLATAITTPQLLRLLGRIASTGAAETARRIAQRLSAIFRFARTRSIVDGDPAAGLVREVATGAPVQRQPALEDLGEARALLDAADRARVAPAIRLASRFLALTAVRLAALRGARWDEIEGVDWSTSAPAPAALWRIPAVRMKLAVAKKADAANDHLVPLSAAAVAVLRQARAIGGADLIFHRGGRPIGKGAIGALYDRCGFAGRHVPHGWRATFSSALNEQYPADEIIIERALAHAQKDKVKAAYDRARHLPRLRFLFDRWAEILLDTPGPGDWPE